MNKNAIQELLTLVLVFVVCTLILLVVSPTVSTWSVLLATISVYLNLLVYRVSKLCSQTFLKFFEKDVDTKPE